MLSEGMQVTNIEEDVYPDPSTLSVKELRQNQENLPLEGEVYRAPMALALPSSDDGGIGEVDDRLTYQPAVPRALQILTPRQVRIVLQEFGFEEGSNESAKTSTSLGMTPVDNARELAIALKLMGHVLNARPQSTRTGTGIPWYEGIQNTHCILPAAQK